MDPTEATKLALRDQIVTARGRLGLRELTVRAEAVADHLMGLREIRYAATVAAYVSVGREPGTGRVLDALREAGKRVILPVLEPDGDLDWATHTGDQNLLPARYGLLEPAGVRLGRQAVATADVVLTPALAVDRNGQRLGRGGGSYDRALGRVPVGTLVCAVLNSEELLERVPVAPHDRPVTAAVTERGVVRLR